jgi:hypothetical protein
MTHYPKRLFPAIALFSFLLVLHASAEMQQPEGMQQVIQRIQLANANNQEKLRSYQWIETTTTTIHDKQRPPRQSICRYASDGSIVKTPLGQSSGRQGGGGPLRGGLIRGLIAKDEKQKAEKEVKQVHELVKLYMPLNRSKFVAALQGDGVHLEQGNPGEDTVILRGYAKPGDEVKITLSYTTGRILGVSVKSWFDKPKDAMTGEVHFSTFGDDISYPAMTTFTAPSKHLSIRTVNSDYSKVAY